MRGFWRGMMIGPTPPSGRLACARLDWVPFWQRMASLYRHRWPIPASQSPSWLWEGQNRAVMHTAAHESAAVCRLASNNALLAKGVI